MNWRGLLFGEIKPAPPQDRRGLNEDWRVGDLARCLVRASGWDPPSPLDPDLDEVRRVSGIVEGSTRDGKFLITALRFEGKPQNQAWVCQVFEKLRPTIEAAEEEFTEELRALQRSRVETNT